MKTFALNEFKTHLLSGRPIIDVRAGIEFNEGSIPGSINIPILNDEERHKVGLCYKQQGRDVAIQLGHRLVTGENLEKKRNQWLEVFKKSPNTLITCFRGGLRSQSAQKFLSDVGVEAPRLEGGYKAARNFFIETLTSAAVNSKFLLISGTTGSGKSHLLRDVQSFNPIVDLEFLACHKGSAFGAEDWPQPAQADFENRMALEFLKLNQQKMNSPILLEDESRVIGMCHIPEALFDKMRKSPVVLVQESVEVRTENIFADYITNRLTADNAEQIFAQYKKSAQKIQKRLGGLRAQEILDDLEFSERGYNDSRETESNKKWIEKLLVWYYDPMYLSSLDRRAPVIEARGTSAEIKNYLRTLV